MASNTEILIKRSLANSAPSLLHQGELAFSYVSNTLFIGTSGSDDAFEIAGYRDYSANFVSGPGEYGNTTSIPIITVAANGQITAINTAVISTTLDIGGDAGGPSSVDLLSQTLTIAGGEGITSNVSGQTITLDVDTTVVRSNTAMMLQTIDGDVQISGNLTISGNVTSIDVQTLNISDPLIYLAGNNYTSDIVDIGFVGNYFDGTTQRHAGVYRHAGDKQFYVFDNYDEEPTDDLINPSDPSFRLATLHTNLTANTANARTLFVSNIIYGDTTNNTIVLAPSTSYGPGVNDQYIIVDPTAPNHIHLRAGGTIDSSTADLYLGGENTHVMVSDSAKETYISANSHTWYFRDDASIELPGQLFVSNLANARTANLVYFDAANGRFSYADDNALTPTSIANGSYSLSISSTDGMLTTNGDGLTLANGAIIKDTSGNAVAFGENAGTLSQGADSVAIGNSAGYNTQGTNAVAVGYGAGNITQGNYGVAIGNSAGGTSQGGYSVAIGNLAGGSNQGGEAVAIGSNAAGSDQGAYAIAIGSGNVGNSQGTGAIAIGRGAGYNAGNYSVALGFEAGNEDSTALGDYAIAIGYRAGYDHGYAGSIVLNASGSNLSADAAGLYINPVRYTATQDATYDGLMFYNSSTKEVRYSYTLDGGNF